MIQTRYYYTVYRHLVLLRLAYSCFLYFINIFFGYIHQTETLSFSIFAVSKLTYSSSIRTIITLFIV